MVPYHSSNKNKFLRNSKDTSAIRPRMIPAIKSALQPNVWRLWLSISVNQMESLWTREFYDFIQVVPSFGRFDYSRPSKRHMFLFIDTGRSPSCHKNIKIMILAEIKLRITSNIRFLLEHFMIMLHIIHITHNIIKFSILIFPNKKKKLSRVVESQF